MSLGALNKRAELLGNLLEGISQAVDTAPMEKRALTPDQIQDCWAILLARNKGVSEEDFAKENPDTYARLQERFLTEEERTQNQLDKLPFA